MRNRLFLRIGALVLVAGLALGTPAGLVEDLAGPRVYELRDLLRSYLRVTGRRRPLVTVPLLGSAARALRAGANLAPDHGTGRVTWEAFLSGRMATRPTA